MKNKAEKVCVFDDERAKAMSLVFEINIQFELQYKNCVILTWLSINKFLLKPLLVMHISYPHKIL